MAYATGSPSTFRAQYERHDRAEALLRDVLLADGVTVEETGFDPHDGGDRVTGHRDRNTDRTPDLRAAGEPLEVKTKKRREHVGNVPLRKWKEYPDGTHFAWFRVGGDRRVRGGWYYTKGENARAVDIEDGFGGEEWVVVRPLHDLTELLERLGSLR